MMNAEGRLFQRYNTQNHNLKVYYFDQGSNFYQLPIALEDLSLSGCCIKSEANLKNGGLMIVIGKRKIKFDIKKLWETEETDQKANFQKERIAAFDDIEKRLNDLYPLVSNAKNETAEYYSENPGSYDILKSTEMILSYLKDIDKLLREVK